MKIEATPDKSLQSEQAQLGAESQFKKRAQLYSSPVMTFSCELSVPQPILEEHKKGYAQLGTLFSPHLCALLSESLGAENAARLLWVLL